ncbi:MAG: hypothetical protein R8P61_04065 [Bacteroidia bacterium]|nr:hypothetical protein [Bacteroidia bacterium]
MEWLNDLKEKFSKRRIRNLDRSKEYIRDFVDIESANKIGVIVNMNHLEGKDLALVTEYLETLKRRNKKILIIELNFNKKEVPHFTSYTNHIFISPTKLNWLDYPTPAIENEIRQHELDILMDFDYSSRMTSKYVCSMAKAKTRTGVHHEGYESCYELMIYHDEESGMKGLIKEFDYFLNMIDNGQKVKA